MSQYGEPPSWVIAVIVLAAIALLVVGAYLEGASR